MLNLLLHINNGKGLQVAVAEVSNAKNRPPQKFYSVREQEEFETLTSEKRREEREATLFLLHEMLGITSALEHHASGKPYLADSHVRISISHARQLVGVALHAGHNAGIDIEHINRHFERVAPRFLSPAEQRFCTSKAHQCLAWCAKETVYKLAGEEGVDFATQIAVEHFTLAREGELQAHFSGKKWNKSFTLSYQVNNDYAVAYAAYD